MNASELTSVIEIEKELIEAIENAIVVVSPEMRRACIESDLAYFSRKTGTTQWMLVEWRCALDGKTVRIADYVIVRSNSVAGTGTIIMRDIRLATVNESAVEAGSDGRGDFERVIRNGGAA